ncbi:hypothetical protein MMC34_004803 [Xylographa carneopallida]|nr:hypothetical protein [Xylographa carneopallida]
MRLLTALLPLLLLTTYAANPSPSSCPFSAPLIHQQDASDSILELFRRQNACQAGYNACTNLGVATACCSTNAVCTPDAANMVACCPSGASCTGTLGATGAAASTTGPLLLGGGNGATTAAGAASTTGNSLFPATSTSPPPSTVANPYFPFLYIPTSFPNAGVCASYYSSCAAELSSCTASLGGEANGITGNGGVVAATAQAAGVTAQAASICSSLYTQGCYGLNMAYCSSLTGANTAATAAATGSGIIVNASGADVDKQFGLVKVFGLGMAVALGLVLRL